MHNKPHTDETKLKISSKLRGRKLSAETRTKMSMSQKGHGGRNKGGHTLSEESKKNIKRGIAEKRYTEDYAYKLSETKKGERNPQSRLNWEKVREIRRLYGTGEYSQNKLAGMFGVGRPTIQDVVQNKTWKEE